MTTTYTPADQWFDAIVAFETAQKAARYTEQTIARRLKQVRRFAVTDTTRGPWRQDFESIERFLQTVPEGHTRAAHRSSLRTFYRWAAAAGRVVGDPTALPEYVSKKKPVPEAWRIALLDFRTYLRSIGRSEQTVTVRLSQLARFARDHASLSPWEVTFDDLVQWVGGHRWAPEGRRAHRSALRLFYQWAYDTDRVTTDPTVKMPVVRRGTRTPRPVVDDDYALALVKADARQRLALRLAAELGLRSGEVVLVHSSDLLNRGGQWSLLVHGKGNKERIVPLTDSLLGALRARGPGWAFPGKVDGHMSSQYMSKIIGQLLPEGVSMHALRHRFATRAYAVNRDVFAVQQLLGHASPSTTQAYVQVPDYDLRHLVETVGS